MAGVLHNDSAGTGQISSAKGSRTVRPQPSRHPCSRRSAPKGVAVGIDPKLLGVLKDKPDGSGQILAGGLGAGTIDQGEGIIALLGQFQGVGETVLHRSHIGKSAAGIAHRKPFPRSPREEKQTGVLFFRVRRFFFRRINVVKHGIPGLSVAVKVVDDFHRFLGIYIVVPG